MSNEENKINSPDVDKKDPDFEEKSTERVESSASVTNEQYDIEPEIISSEVEDDELENKEHIDIEYSFNGDDIREGLTIFQSVTIRKRNIIYSVILACLFLLYMTDMLANNGGSRLSIFLAVVCIAVLLLIWYMPRLHIKKTAQTVDEHPNEFSISIYDSCVKVGEGESAVILDYHKNVTQVIETTNLFMVCAGKERIFILPKRCLGEEQQEEKIREIFTKGVGEKYIVK